MFYAAFPPEINSGRMYTGPGSGPMLAAAAAWDGLAAELQATAAGYSSIISGLTGSPWVGPSSLAMAAAVAPYLTWMNATAEQAAQAGAQAAAAASAYEAAFVAHVPPPEIAANRTLLASLVATNLFGQNTAAIAATEAQYAEMWVQDAIAMDSYAGASAAASQVTPFAEPPQITSGSGLVSQAAAVSQAAGVSASSAQSILATGPISWLLQLGADIATGYNDTITQILNTLFGPAGAETYLTLFAAAKAPSATLAALNDEGLLVNLPISQFLKFAHSPFEGAAGALPKEALGGGLVPHVSRSTLFGAVSGPGDVSAHLGRGTLVGALKVPPSWAPATPGIRMVAAALSAAGPEAVPAAALGEASLLSSISMAGMAGSALGAGAPDVVGRAGVRKGMTPLKDLANKHSPEGLKRLVAQISEKPESVQHHDVDQEGLDSLLERLSKKPGIHAVHLSKGGKVVPADKQLG